MIVNLRLILAFLLVFVGLTSCQRDEPGDPVPAPRPRVTLTLSLSSPGIISDAKTKAPIPASDEEKKLYNLNIFLFPKSTQPALQEDKRHYYIPQSGLVHDPTDATGTKYLPIELKDVCIGEYDVYIVANNNPGSGNGNTCLSASSHDDPDKCPLTRESIENLRISYLEPTGLLMSGKIEGMKVLASKQDVELNLTFNMSRINFGYELATAEAQQLEVYTVTLQNAAVATYPFNPNKVLEARDYRPVELWTGEPLSQNAYRKTVYVAPNPQRAGGVTIPAGGDPNLYRTAKYAPVNATYAYFNCKHNGAIIGYTAYLGDDRPDEANKIYFDILPNTIYDVTTVFSAIDPSDDRQCSFSITPNRKPLLVGETSDFVYAGTNVPVTSKTLYIDATGKVAIETTFSIKTRNYFNDRFVLNCYSSNITNTKFLAYVNGSSTPLPNQAEQGFLFYLIEDTGQNVENNVEVKVVYERYAPETSQTLYFEVKNRNGELLKTETPALTIY